MNADPNAEGFRILRGDPALLMLELLWRWSFGLGLLAVLFISYTHLRQAILVSDADQALFASPERDPLAVANAAAALAAASQPLLLRALAQITGVAAALWIMAAVPGRGLIARLVGRRLAADYGAAIAPDASRWSAFAILKIARVLMLAILLIGYLAGAMIAARRNASGQNLLVDAFIITTSLAVSAILWSSVNWVLSLAPIFVVRDGLSALDSIVAALAFIRRTYSHLAAIAIWNSTLRGLFATLITLAGVATVAWRPHHPAWLAPALLAAQMLLYLVTSDYLLLARFAAYTSVAMRELSLRVPQATGR